MPAKILVVEDDKVTQDLVAHLLRIRDHKITTAADGDVAIELATTLSPDIVLCDINLPGTSGFEVLRRLRETPATRNTPVIALTASGAQSATAEAQVHDRITGLGFTAYISKPFDIKTFAECVETFLPNSLRGTLGPPGALS